MSGYKLYYFNVRGRGELARLTFAAANIEFEDIRLTKDEWAVEKATGRSPFGQVPFIITPDGKVLGQSLAIMKYICREAGFSPEDIFDEAVANMICDGVEDLRNGCAKIYYEQDEAKKEEMKKEFVEITLPAQLQKLEAILKDHNEGKGFFLGDKLTCADITFFDLMNLFSSGEPTVPEPLEKFPLLVDLYKRVLEVPGIKAWVEKRPKTDH